MKTLITTAALSLALAFPVLAQDARPAWAPAPAAKTETPAAKVQAPVTTAQAPAGQAPATKSETPKAAAPATTAVAPKPDVKAPATPPAKTDAKATVALVNINTATAAELDALPKIGAARTKAIIAGRPYKSVDDLIARKVIPSDAFEAIKAKVSVK